MAEPTDPSNLEPDPGKPELAGEQAKEDAEKKDKPAEESNKPKVTQTQSVADETFIVYFGHSLYPLNTDVTRQVLWLGKMLFARSGLLLPPVQLIPNSQQKNNLYCLNFLGQEVGRLAIPPAAFLVLGQEQEMRKLEPMATLNPHPLTGERTLWVFSTALQRVHQYDLFVLSPLEFMAYFFNWLFYKNHEAFFSKQRCQQSLLALTEHVPSLAPLRGFLLTKVDSIWLLCLTLMTTAGSIRNMPQILHEYHRQYHLDPKQSINEVSRAIIDKLQADAEHEADSKLELTSPEYRRLAAGLIYMHASQSGWSEQLANRLTETEMNQLLQILMEISAGIPGAKVPLTQEVISRLDATFISRTPQEYFDIIRQLLDGKSLDMTPLNAVDRLALLMLSLPVDCAPDPATLDFLSASKKKALLVRIAFLTFNRYYGTIEHGPPTRHLLDIRDQVLLDFLDFVSGGNRLVISAPTALLPNLLNFWVKTSPFRVTYILLRHYYHVFDPTTRLIEAARSSPARVKRALRQYFLSYADSDVHNSLRLAPWRRGSHILAALDLENLNQIKRLLILQGAWIRRCVPPTTEQKNAALHEFARHFWPYRSVIDQTFRWQ